MAIIAIGQGYEQTNIHYDYKTGSRIDRGISKLIEIEKQRERMNNARKKRTRCYNYNKFEHMAEECR